jgi:hypothetical protein
MTTHRAHEHWVAFRWTRPGLDYWPAPVSTGCVTTPTACARQALAPQRRISVAPLRRSVHQSCLIIMTDHGLRVDVTCRYGIVDAHFDNRARRLGALRSERRAAAGPAADGRAAAHRAARGGEPATEVGQRNTKKPSYRCNRVPSAQKQSVPTLRPAPESGRQLSDWSHITAVTLNPERDSIVAAAAHREDLQPMGA